jgi:hypothetical protein
MTTNAKGSDSHAIVSDSDASQLVVKLLSGEAICIDVDANTTVDCIKDLIQGKLGHSTFAQVLHHDIHVLSDGNATLEELGLTNGGALNLTILPTKRGCDLIDEDVPIGATVRLISDEAAVKAAFLGARRYRWDDGMRNILGTKQVVVDAASDGFFGLKEASAGSGFPVWYYPFSVVEEVAPCAAA